MAMRARYSSAHTSRSWRSPPNNRPLRNFLTPRTDELMNRAPLAELSPHVVVFATRERARALARGLFPRRYGRIVMTRSTSECETALKDALVDAALVDVGSGSE